MQGYDGSGRFAVLSTFLRAVTVRMFSFLLVCLDLGRSIWVPDLGSRVSAIHGNLGHRRFRVCRGAVLQYWLRRLEIPSSRKQDMPKGYASLGKHMDSGHLGGYFFFVKNSESSSYARVMSG